MTDLRAQVSEAQAAPVAQASAADSCLSAPKGATPSGSHWYYRIDRVTKRQCWYLREENDKADDKFARAAPPASAPASSPPAAEPAPVQAQANSRKSFDDARAEWVAQQNRAAAGSLDKAEPRTTGAAPAPAAQNGPSAAMPNVLAPAPLASMRWNDARGASSSTNPPNQQIAAAATPADQPVQAEEVQQPTAEQAAPVAAEPAKPTASLQKLLLVMAAALALAGLTVSAIVRIGRMRARRAMHRKRRAMWDAARTKRPAPPVFHDEDARLRRTGAVQHTRVPKERPRVPQERARVPQERLRVPQERVRVPQERVRAPQERVVRAPQERARVPQERERDQQVTEMLARLARSAQT
ncbi:hypothetical protein [Bradyrhizobium sp. sGM-13]|uniref:hypothetical protein n=1 Tax=Bradyrhizobium sp. sGM-13 TaxID=2831781 RepID=UPI001BD0997F|nr:hypothetical protein [Bradyrhizobium sp. sGM-13]